MRPGDLIAGQPFKAALRMLAVFLALFVLAGWLLFTSVTNSITEELTAQVTSEAVLLQDIYQASGIDGVRTSLDDLARIPVPGRTASLFDAGGISLTGPVSVLPDIVGVEQRDMSRLTAGRIKGQYILTLRRLDQFALLVGRDARPVEVAEARLLAGLVGFGAVLCVVALGLGLRASRRSMQRLMEMEQALAQYSGGDMDARLPVIAQDQFDRVSGQMNRNLDRLSRLVGGYRTTASAIAHDLKTPLSHAQIALYEAADAADAGQNALPEIEEALRATETLNGVFDTMLRISQIETRTKWAMAPVDLGAVVRKVGGFMAPMAEAQEQALELDTARAGTVQGDAGMIEQALVNMVKNAVLHAGRGARITICADGPVLEVADTGPGVTETDLSRLLEPFARGDAARTHEGSGLGLALVRAVADRHGAGILLRNTTPGFAVKISFANLKKV